MQNIRGVIYQKKLDKTELGPMEIGVIAQELEDYVPEVIVKPADESEFLQVIYPQLNALLIERPKKRL